MNKPVITGCVKLDEKVNRICDDIDVRGVQEQVDDELAKRKNVAYGRKFWEAQQIAYMQTETYADVVNPITVCRGVMRETLDDDGGFRQGYIANIAMVMYDNLQLPVQVDGCDARISLSKCNDLAELILQKVFYSE